MRIVAEYDFNDGKKAVQEKYANEYQEVVKIIGAVDSSICKNKKSTEKTMMGRMLYAPLELNRAFSSLFLIKGWNKFKIECDYCYGNYLDGYTGVSSGRTRPYREMDFIKPNKKLGIEVQFGKYAFMVYNVCAKMTIFRNLDIIDTGIEIVPVKNFADQMSTGVSYFEQFAWDLHHRGVSNIDIPVLILGVDK